MRMRMRMKATGGAYVGLPTVETAVSTFRDH